MALILTVLAVFAMLVLSELWWRYRKPHDEFSRKFIHIFVGSFAAFWPYYLDWNWIIILSAAFIAGVAASKFFNIFKSIHAVERPTWGEVMFAASVGILALITKEPWIYTAALLHMSLADGLAAIVGVTWGKKSRYKIFGHYKSIIGSTTFFVVSVAILTVYSLAASPLSPTVIIGTALLATSLENIGVRGLDNLAVPLVVGVILTRF
jgi:phytol kinase